MDFKSIQALGHTTSRILEIEDLLKSLNKLAKHSIDEESSSLNINLNHRCRLDGLERSENQHAGDVMEEFLKNIFSSKMKNGPRVASIRTIEIPHFSVSLSGRFQFIILDAIKKALKEEQDSLSEELKIKTGTL